MLSANELLQSLTREKLADRIVELEGERFDPIVEAIDRLTEAVNDNKALGMIAAHLDEMLKKGIVVRE